MIERKVQFMRRGWRVPDWGEWITCDANGEVLVHAGEPRQSPFLPMWISNGKTRLLTLVIDNKTTIHEPEWGKCKKYIGKSKNKVEEVE